MKEAAKAGLRYGASAVAAVQGVAGPWLDLLIRIWMAQAFLTHDVTDLMLSTSIRAPLHASWWSSALQQLAASGFGATVQAACPILLALGLLGRPAAAALLIQIWVIAMPGASHDAMLFWTALLLRIVIIGPGALSLDKLLGRGAVSFAVPGAAAVVRALGAVRRLGPAYQLGLRLWLAGAMAVTASMQKEAGGWIVQMPGMVAALAPVVAVGLGALLASGLFARGAALALLALVPLGEIGASGDLRLFWALTLAVIAVHGAGPWSLDALCMAWARRRMLARAPADLPHVVVVGAGFGGLAAVRGLRHSACRITLVDRRNHHVFQPLLYQVATASLSPSDIAAPARAMLRDQANVRVMLGEVTGIDTAGRAVLLGATRLGYDWLVVATGARHSYFGRDDWGAFAPGLKSIEDSTAIRRRLLLAFEEAENRVAAEREAWLTFVVVGGGPTGVELAGAIAELARFGLAEEFQQIDPASARVLLVQSGPRLLPAFPESLSREAERALTRLGVDVRVNQRVEGVDAEGVTIGGKGLGARTVLWAAGVMASPAARWLGVEADRAGRVPVGADLCVAGLERVFVVGDTAKSLGWGGKEVPGLAPAAKQGGGYAARVIRAQLAGRRKPLPFRYHHLGSLATIGRQSAVADFGVVRLHGALAWWLWGAAHITFLVSGRSRVTVLVQWLWAYLTFQRSTRLITEPGEPTIIARPGAPEPAKALHDAVG